MSQLFMSLDWKHTIKMLQFRCRYTGYTDQQFVIPQVNLFSLLYKYYVHAWASIARPPLHNYIIVRNSHSSCFHLGNIVWNEFPPCFFTKIDLQVLRIAYSMQDKEAPHLPVKFRKSTNDKQTRVWIQIFLIFIPIWGRFPLWLIFFRWVETTNQQVFLIVKLPETNSVFTPWK